MNTITPDVSAVAEVEIQPDVNLDSEIGCECMLCDLPLDFDHGPIEWRVHLDFPGPYPAKDDSVMLLCSHCKEQ